MQNQSRLIVGLTLIFIGMLYLIDSFGIFEFPVSKYIFSWKTLLIFIGLVMFVNNKRKITGIVLMSLGVAFWIPSFFGVNITFWRVFFPLVLIGIGALLVSKKNQSKVFGNYKVKGDYKIYETDEINDVSIFSGSHKIVESKNFKGGTLTSVFGSIEINLVNAELSSENPLLDVFTMFGGITLIVPGDWKVHSDVVSVIGGVNDKRRIMKSEVDKSKTLIVKGMAFFGGIEIKSY